MEPHVHAGDGLDPRLGELLRRITVSTVGWDALLDMQLPTDMSLNAAWKFVHGVNDSVGMHVPVPSASFSVFYRYSVELVESIVRLYQVAAETASLMPASEYRFHPRNVNRAIEDAAHAARLDGYPADAARLLAAYEGREQPESVGERLALNMLRAEDRLAWVSDVELSLETVRRCVDLVCEGVDEAELGVKGPLQITPLVPRDVARGIPPNRVEHERMFFDYIDGASGEPQDFAFTRTLVTPDYLRAFMPGVRTPTLSGRLIAHLVANKVGMPTLGMLALSSRRLRWELGELPDSETIYTADQVRENQRHEVDLRQFDTTMLHTMLVRIALAEASDLLAFVKGLGQRNRSVKEALYASSLFNQRQRGILMRAAKGADRTFTIRYHQGNHDISYSTARRDFQELADRGFLEIVMDGKTQVFRASPSIDARLSEAFGIASLE